MSGVCSMHWCPGPTIHLHLQGLLVSSTVNDCAKRVKYHYKVAEEACFVLRDVLWQLRVEDVLDAYWTLLQVMHDPVMVNLLHTCGIT